MSENAKRFKRAHSLVKWMFRIFIFGMIQALLMVLILKAGFPLAADVWLLCLLLSLSGIPSAVLTFKLIN